MLSPLGYASNTRNFYPPKSSGAWSSAANRFAADGVETVNNGNFDVRVLQAKQPVLVVFTDGGSQQDKRLEAALSELKRQPNANNLMIVQVDCRTSPELARTYGVKTLPTLKLFRPAQADAGNLPSGETLEGVRPAAHIARYLGTAARR